MMKLNQIFEFSMALDNGNFQKILSVAYNMEKHEEEYIDRQLGDKGITVIYRNSQYKKKVKIIANSRLLLGDNKIDSDKLIRKLDKYIRRYFGFRYQLSDFSLSGVILAVDIDAHDHDSVSAYLKVLHRIGRVKGFSPIYFDCFDNNKSFCLDGNSNGIQFLIYDLENLLKSQLGRTDIGRKKLKLIAAETQGILRAEVRLTKPKVIRSYTNKTDISG